MPDVSLTISNEPLSNATEHVGDPEDGAVTVHTLGLPLVSKAMPMPCSVMAIPALAPAMMAWSGENEIVAVVAVALTLEVSVIAGPVMPPTDADAVMADIKPALVVSRNVGVAAEKSFEVAAAMLVNPACAAVGVVNFVTAKMTGLSPSKFPDVSLAVNTGPTHATVHVAEEGTRIIQALGGASVTANAMPDPGSVMAIPALAPGMMV